MPAIDPSEHFATYTDNNRIKHGILTEYLKRYTTVLAEHADGFHYVDGFAGPGRYAGEPGSPILAMSVLAEQSRRFSMSLVEADASLAQELRVAIASQPRPENLFEDPLILTGAFSDHLQTILARRLYSVGASTATIAFLDPCRASGYGAEEIRAILRKKFGECLIFWNYVGVNRWLGSLAAEQSSGSQLSHMFGTSDALRTALEIWRSARSLPEKERGLLSHFLNCVRDYSGAEFLVPFRFVSASANRTSHYLVHCSRHPLAFRLMKEVMGSLRSSDDPGQFSFLGYSDLGDQISLFVPEAEVEAAEAILTELGKGQRPVRLFTKQWIERPSDLFREKDYREILLQLEADGRIRVFLEDGVTPAPAHSRRRNKGKPSLAPQLRVQRTIA
jgi:three-Cys-motif partner protein